MYKSQSIIRHWRRPRVCSLLSLCAGHQIMSQCLVTSSPRGRCTGARAAAWSAGLRSRAGSGGRSATLARAPGRAVTVTRRGASSGPGWVWWGRGRPGLNTNMFRNDPPSSNAGHSPRKAGLGVLARLTRSLTLWPPVLISSMASPCVMFLVDWPLISISWSPTCSLPS